MDRDLIRRNRWDKLFFFSSWIGSTALIAYILVAHAWRISGTQMVKASFTGSAYTDTIGLSVVFGLVLALALFGVRRMLSGRS